MNSLNPNTTTKVKDCQAQMTKVVERAAEIANAGSHRHCGQEDLELMARALVAYTAALAAFHENDISLPDLVELSTTMGQQLLFDLNRAIRLQPA